MSHAPSISSAELTVGATQRVVTEELSPGINDVS